MERSVNSEQTSVYTGPDRRKKPTPMFSRYILIGRRQANRGLGDRKQNYYVDRYSPKLLIALLLIVILSLLDAIYTYHYVNLGGSEANPLMDFFLKLGGPAFFIYKYVVTAMGIFFLCLHKNFRFVQTIIVLILVLYVSLMFYHVSILQAF
ncbi:MAG: DUF5658 family protein [bacterium]|nr:DUF5658 family protein [bacterium]